MVMITETVTEKQAQQDADATSRKKEVIKDVGVYAFSNYLSQIANVVTGLVARRIMGPTLTGIWTTLQVIFNYTKFSSLGTVEATVREIPYYRGKGDGRKADQIRNVVFSFSTLTALLLSVGLFVVSLFLKKHVSKELFYGLITISFLVLLQRIFNYLTTLLRAYRDFTYASKMILYSALVGLVLTVILTPLFSIYGFYVATVSTFVINIFMIQYHARYRFTFDLDMKQIVPLMSFGFPLLLLGVISTIFRSIDKIVIAKMMGFEELGYYSIAVMASSYLFSFPNSLDIVLFTHFQEKYGERDKMHDLKGFLNYSTLSLAYLMPLLIGFAWIVSPLAIKLLLPRFIPGIAALKILILSVFYFSLTQQYGTFLITIKKHLQLLPIMSCLIVFSVFLNVLFIKKGFGINGVALATTISFAGYFFVYFLLAARHILKLRDILTMILKVNLSFFYFLLVLIAGDLFVKIPDHLYYETLFKLCVFSVFMLPVFTILEKETSIFRSIIHIVKEKFEKNCL